MGRITSRIASGIMGRSVGRITGGIVGKILDEIMGYWQVVLKAESEV